MLTGTLARLSSLFPQAWLTEPSRMTSMPCAICGSSSTTCPSAARTRLPSASAMIPGGWQAVPPLIFQGGLTLSTLMGPPGSLGILEQVVEYGQCAF